MKWVRTHRPDSRWKTHLRLIIGAICLVCCLPACDYAFDPLLPNDTLYFSIYGTLDASADSQIIRVGPVRTTILTTPDPIDATVTLEHLESGTTVTIRDSLYQYEDDSWAWNYITDMEIEPEESYRLTATRSDGVTSHTTVTLPSEYPEPRYTWSCESIPNSPNDRLSNVAVYVEGVDRLVVFNLTVIYTDNVGIVHTRTVFHIDDARDLTGGSIQVLLNAAEDRREINESRLMEGLFPVDKYEMFMVSAGPDWPVTEGLSLEEITLPGVARNVENGLGLIAGIVSKSFEIKHGCDE